MRASSCSRLFLVVLPLSALACGGGSKPPAPPARTCSTPALPAAPERVAPAPIPAPVPPSTVVIGVAVDLAKMRRELDGQVSPRLAEERDRDVGAPGRLTYTVDRGPFGFSVDQDRFVVATDIAARASICKPLGPLGCPQYASCDPGAKVRASVPLALTPEYAFSPSSVTYDTTRRCLVTAVNIDVTPMIESRARGETAKVQQRIDQSLPKLKKEAERAWTLLGTVVPVGKNGCLTLEPSGVVQGPSEVRGDKLWLRLGVVSSPRVESPCNPGPSKPLPALGRDPKLGDTFTLDMPVRLAPAELERAFGEIVRGAEVPAGGGGARVESIDAKPTRDGVLLEAHVVAPVCGALAFMARPKWDAASKLVRFDVVPLQGEQERAGGLNVGAMAQAFSERFALPLPVTDDEVRKSLTERRVPVAPGEAELTIAVASVSQGQPQMVPEGVEVRFAVKGTARIDVK